jgi:hypothetical protein
MMAPVRPSCHWLRVVWDGRFGTMLIEVVGGQVFVNGQQVLPVEPRCS